MNNLTKNIVFVVIISIISLLIGFYVLKLYSDFFPAENPSIYCCKPRPRMWMKDSTIGYKNKPNLSLRAFSGIKGFTNDIGFRIKRIITPTNKEGKIRIFGVGDSVMWGMRVNQEDSFLGLLEEMLMKDKINTEVINAGVVGYSTLQEYLFLKKFILPLKPDIVLVNFCANDFLPSEDPFSLRYEVYEKYVSSLFATSEYSFDSLEREIIEDILESGLDWKVFHKIYKKDLHVRNALCRVLLEIPILKMSYLAKEHDFRLVYLLIPGTFNNKSDIDGKVERLKKLFKHNGIEYLDFTASLLEDTNVYHNTNMSFGSKVLSKISKLLHFVYLGKIDPLHSLRRIKKIDKKSLAQLEKNLPLYHSKRNFIDRKGHPSKKGNNIIASGIYKYLLKDFRNKPSL